MQLLDPRRPSSWRGIALAALAAIVWVAGCSSDQRLTPDACLAAFDEAMRSGDSAKAARLFALDKWSEDNSTDWETYAPSQRELIVKTLRERKAAQLLQIRPVYLQGNYRPAGAPRIEGEWASVVLVGSGASMPVRLHARNGNWSIYSLGSLPNE